MSPKAEPILKRFNRTDNRVQVLCAVLWANLRRNKPIGQIHRAILLRRNLIGNDAKLTPLGVCFVERYETRFRAMQPPVRELSPETLEKMRQARERRKELRHE